MKSLFPQNQLPDQVTDAQKADFKKSFAQTAGVALVLAVVADLFYYLVYPGNGWPAKPGIVVWGVSNIVFAASAATVALYVWRHSGGTWPFFRKYGGTGRDILNGIALGVIVCFLVLGAVLPLIFTCMGGFAESGPGGGGNILFGQVGENAYIGVKVVVVYVGMELGGKVEDQPPK